MIELTARAQKHLNGYLGEVRASLAGCPSVDSADVERDVTEHIEKSLCETSPPVDLPDLTRVLDALGSPSQWVPEEELSWKRKLRLRVRRVLTRLHSGPEDFRLAYLSIGLFALAIPVFRADPDSPWLLVCLGFSFLFARAALAAEADHQRLGAQRWLLYPVMILVYVPFAVALLLWTVVPGLLLADLAHEEVEALGGFSSEMVAAHSAVTSTALWWFLLGLALCRWPGLVRNTFYPFTNGFRGWHGLMLSAVGLLVLIAALGLGGVVLSEGPNALRIFGG